MTSAPAAAAKAIKGKLSEPGYDVVGQSGGGEMSSAGTGGGDFRLRPVAETVTLHLRSPQGKYAGPVVVGGTGKRAILGVEAGASLGRVTVHDGYASAEVRKRSVDASRTARARGGVPLGAGNFGRVRSSTPKKSPPGDPDLDGIPNALDIDDDGDLVLDDLDRSKQRRSAQGLDIEMGYEMQLAANLVQTRNANAPGVIDGEIDAFLASAGTIMVAAGIQESATGEGVPSTAELDCGRPQSRTDTTLGGLAYCTTGGTGRIMPTTPGPLPPRDSWPRFPEACDTEKPEPDGFAELGRGCEMFLHGASSTQIGTGDHLFAYVTGGGVQEMEVDTLLRYVPATPQALVSYDDGRGPVSVQYPVPGPDQTGACAFGPCGTWPGMPQNPLPVVARPNGDVDDVILTVTLWRPQRRPTSQAECAQPEQPTCVQDEWIDIGGLQHFVGVSDHGCPEAAYDQPGQNLEVVAAPPPDPENEDARAGDGWILDKTLDARAKPANTFTYTVNLSECLRWAPEVNNDDAFVPPDTWELDDPPRMVHFGSRELYGIDTGITGTGVGHNVWFKRVPPPSP